MSSGKRQSSSHLIRQARSASPTRTPAPSDLLARPRDQLLAPADPGDARLRALAQENIDRLEAEFEEPGHALVGAVGKVGVACVAGDALLLRPTQQLVDRPAEQLALQVPQRDVDGTDRVAAEPGATVRCRAAPQHVPVLLGCRGVLPDE